MTSVKRTLPCEWFSRRGKAERRTVVAEERAQA